MSTSLVLALVGSVVVSAGTLVWVLLDARKRKEQFDRDVIEYEKEQATIRATQAAEEAAALARAEAEASEASEAEAETPTHPTE